MAYENKAHENRVKVLTQEIQIRNTVRHRCILAEMTKFKNSYHIKCWQGCGGTRTLTH